MINKIKMNISHDIFGGTKNFMKHSFTPFIEIEYDPIAIDIKFQLSLPEESESVT